MSKKKNVYLRPMVITAGTLFGSEHEPIWEHKNCATSPKTNHKIAKGSIQLQSESSPDRQKHQERLGHVQQNGRLTLILIQKTAIQSRLKISQFLGFTKGSGYAINIVRAFNIAAHKNEKDYFDLRCRIITAMRSGLCIETHIYKEIRGGSIKTVNLIKGGVGKGFLKDWGKKKHVFYVSV